MARQQREGQIQVFCEYCKVGFYDQSLSQAFERLNKHVALECAHTVKARAA